MGSTGAGNWDSEGQQASFPRIQWGKYYQSCISLFYLILTQRNNFKNGCWGRKINIHFMLHLWFVRTFTKPTFVLCYILMDLILSTIHQKMHIKQTRVRFKSMFFKYQRTLNYWEKKHPKKITKEKKKRYR